MVISKLVLHVQYNNKGWKKLLLLCGCSWTLPPTSLPLSHSSVGRTDLSLPWFLPQMDPEGVNWISATPVLQLQSFHLYFISNLNTSLNSTWVSWMSLQCFQNNTLTNTGVAVTWNQHRVSPFTSITVHNWDGQLLLGSTSLIHLLADQWESS